MLDITKVRNIPTYFSMIMKTHKVADEVAQIALSGPHSRESAIQRDNSIPNRLLKLTLQARRQSFHQLHCSIILRDSSRDVAAHDIKIPTLLAVLSSPSFYIAKLLKVGPGTKNMGVVYNVMRVEMVMAAKYHVDETFFCFFRKLEITWFPRMR